MFLISLWVVKYRYKCVYGRYDTDIWLDIGIQSYEAATGATLQSQSLFNNMSLEMFPFLATRRPTTLTTAPLRIVVLCRKFTTTSRGIFSLSRHQEANNSTINNTNKNICVVQEIYNNIPGDIFLIPPPGGQQHHYQQLQEEYLCCAGNLQQHPGGCFLISPRGDQQHHYQQHFQQQQHQQQHQQQQGYLDFISSRRQGKNKQQKIIISVSN